MTGFIPAVVHSAASNNSFYTTRLVMANLSRSAATVTLTYVPDVPLDPPVSPVTVAIAAGGGTQGLAEGRCPLERVRHYVQHVGDAEDRRGTGFGRGRKPRPRSTSRTSPRAGRSRRSTRHREHRRPNSTVCSPSSRPNWRLISRASGRHLPGPGGEPCLPDELRSAELGGAPLTVEVRAVKAGGGVARLILGRRTYELRAFQRLQVNRCR